MILIKEQGIQPGWKARMVGLQEQLVFATKTRIGRDEEWARIAAHGVHLWNVDRLIVRIADGMIDWDRPVVVELDGKKVYEGRVQPNLTTALRGAAERFDFEQLYWAELEVGENGR